MLSIPTFELFNLGSGRRAQDHFSILPFEITMEEIDLGKHCVAYDKTTHYSRQEIC